MPSPSKFSFRLFQMPSSFSKFRRWFLIRNCSAIYRSPSELSVTSKTNSFLQNSTRKTKLRGFILNITKSLFDINIRYLLNYLNVSYLHYFIPCSKGCILPETYFDLLHLQIYRNSVFEPIQFIFKERTDETMAFYNSLQLASKQCQLQLNTINFN